MAAFAGPRTRRHAGVFRRALRREVSQLRDRRRLLAMAILISVGGLMAAAIVARGDPAGADARAYWAAVRIWLNGGDPYPPAGPFLPYVYAPWMLPLFAPWAVSVGCRLGRVARQLDHPAPLEPRLGVPAPATGDRGRVPVLFFPIGANLDTGNIDIFLVFMLWAAQSAEPRIAGLSGRSRHG